MSRPKTLVRILLGAFFLLAASSFLQAAKPNVTAVLTSSETEIGQPVQLQIKVTGSTSATPPADIDVPGLEISYTGTSQEFQLNGFNASSSIVYNYTILPTKPGSFTIPPQRVRTANGTVETEALRLNVAAGNGSRGGSTARSSAGIDERKLVFAELIVPKESAYVGEVVPVEIRLGFNTRVRARLAEGPNISGQGFTTARMPEPQQTMETIDGRTYQVVIFKTAIAAARSGKFEVGPVEAKAIVQVPRRSGARPRSPFDIFGMDDPFNDPFFSNPFGGMMEQREVTFKSSPATLDIKPLPPNAPPSFAGAIGVFSLTTEVKPKKAQVGDPFTITASISGRGNFDRVTAPNLTDDRGWHSYPPTSKFKSDDDVGISGTKTFELVLTPNESKTAIPALSFSYFDPLKERYVTLKGDRIPVLVEGGTAATPAIASASAAPPAAAAPSPAAPTQDILYQLTEHGSWSNSFTPVFTKPVFWAAQVVPFLALVGFAGWETRRQRKENREEQRRTAWLHETSELERKLRRSDGPPEQYFAEALRLVQLKTALARRIEPNTVDAEMAVAAFDLPNEKKEQVRELFRRSDEVRYSGRQNGDGTTSEETRREVLELIESLA